MSSYECTANLMENNPTLLVSAACRLDSNTGEHVFVSDSACCFELWLKTVRYNSISAASFPGSYGWNVQVQMVYHSTLTFLQIKGFFCMWECFVCAGRVTLNPGSRLWILSRSFGEKSESDFSTKAARLGSRLTKALTYISTDRINVRLKQKITKAIMCSRLL